MILYQNYAVNHFLDLCCLAMVSTPKWKGSILVIRYKISKKPLRLNFFLLG